jgi:hypothetical protein
MHRPRVSGMGFKARLSRGLALVPLLVNAAAAAPFESATVRRIIDGRQVYINRQQAKVNQTAGRGQEISTGSSRTELLFEKRAIGFLGQNSLITLGQECFRLKSGRVLINGPQSSCLGSKVLGVRGTTYVLSSTESGGYELAVLTGTATVGDQIATDGSADTQSILSRHPSLSPVVGLGSSAWGSNAGGTTLGQAAGLILGDLTFFTPLVQKNSSSLLYSYSTGSSNFDGFWGASSEVGYSWYDPNNQSSNTLLVGYDGWQIPGCFHSQVAVGGQIERNRWQFSANGGIPSDNCQDSLGFAIARVGIPVASLGERSIHLSLSPYVLHGLGNQYGGGRIGVNVPVGNALEFMAYGQYDKLLDSVVGGQVTYRFATAGRFVRDPNLPTPGQRSPLSWQNQSFKTGQPLQLALGQRSTAAISDISSPLLAQAGDTVIQAGEEATFNAQGDLISKRAISRDRYSALVASNLTGQNLLPESHAIAATYKKLYGASNQALLSVTGVNWLIAAQTPFPRLRADNNLVIPEDKLPKTVVAQQQQQQQQQPETTYTYVCRDPNGTGILYKPSSPDLAGATRYTTTNRSNTPECSSPFTTVEFL